MFTATQAACAAAWTAPRTHRSSSRDAVRASARVCHASAPSSRPSARSFRWERRHDGFAPDAPAGVRGDAVVARAGPGGAGPGGDLYALLNVPPTATKKEIKAAYKKAALKFHPDVNKAPDAAERFNEAKQAYQTLADEDSRRRYDALRNGGGFGGFGGFGGSRSSSRTASSSPRSSAGTRSSQPSSSSPDDEPFYGFSDFWSDMEKEFEAFERKRPDPARPRTLWEELEALGEEFVDFLEDETRALDEETRRRSKESDAASNGRTETKRTSAEKDGNVRGASSSSYASSGTGKSSGGASRAPPPKRESVDEMLEKLKRDMGMK